MEISTIRQDPTTHKAETINSTLKFIGFALVLAAAFSSGTLTLPRPVLGTEAGDGPDRKIHQYKSRHFLVNTDLAAGEAEAMLSRLEATLRWTSKYWGRSLRQPIECFVVRDLANWQDEQLPSPIAKVLLRRIGGGVDLEFDPGRRRRTVQAKIYAVARQGVAEHETVHAYCAEAFGACGPEWYKEGMAELACYPNNPDGGLLCAPEVIHTLRSTPTRNMAQIVGGPSFTKPISASLSRLAPNRDTSGDGRPAEPLKQWRTSDDAALQKARQSYYWSWAVCYFLSHNPNYSDRFRVLGRGYLNRQDVSFARAFSARSAEVDFEFRLFLDHVENGYRSDLCCWDWNKKFSPADERRATSVRIRAARGYQPTGLLVTEGHEYQFTATGKWKTEAAGAETSADGDANADWRGRLVGVVLEDFKLCEPIELGTRGTFIAPCSGRLYLRCQDAWHQLGDNDGAVNVRLQRTSL